VSPDLDNLELAPPTDRDFAFMRKASEFLRRSAEDWYIGVRREHLHSRMELEVVVLKPICDDCLAMMDRPTFVERVLDPSKKSEVVPLFPLETVPERLRMYERSTRSVHLYPYPKRPSDWYGVHCSRCGQRMDTKRGDDTISVYEVPFADYFGLPEPEDAPKSLRGKSRKKEQERLLSLYGGRCFECGTELTLDKNLTLDHVVPRSRGGTWLTTNLQPFCEGCQIKKADLPFETIKVALDMLLRPAPSDSYDGPIW
jgi:hypothetical protein